MVTTSTKKFFATALAVIITILVFGQTKTNPWQNMQENAFAKKNVERRIVPAIYRTLFLDLDALAGILAGAPMRFTEAAKSAAPTLAIPMPEGKFQNFKLVEAPVMASELAAQYPDMRSYAGWSDEDPTAYLRCGVTQKGFHAVFFSSRHSPVYIDIYAVGETQQYICYFKKDLTRKDDFICHVKGLSESDSSTPGFQPPVSTATGDCKLRNYRLALACTGEYAQFHGGTVASVMAEYNVAMTRVNGIYERDLAVTMVMVPNTNLLIYLNSATDPYTNNSGGMMLGQNQTTCNTVIGNTNYDIGHVFSTGGGGVANLNAVCSTNNKARGVTGLGSPVGDPFYVDYVAHEMGHQFGGNHTFNSNQGSCSGNQNNATAFEPGSATTIMGYAGICGTHNVQSNSDDYFHAISLDEISAHITGTSCAVVTTTGNNAPTVTVTSAFYALPVSTPFALTAQGSDPDGNTLTYCWEQMDNQVVTMPPVSTNTGGPAFRSLKPATSPTRYFPNLNAVISGAAPIWEVLPSVTRTMNFRVTVRDNFPGAGCTDETDMNLSFTATAGPFVVTNPNTSAVVWNIGEVQTVTWNVANTNAAPVNVSHVDILLSVDGGLTYPHLLAAAVANDGTESITVPNAPSNLARVMVRSKNNVFYDISNQNFLIQEPPSPTFTLVATPQAISACKTGVAEYTLNLQSLLGFSEDISFDASGTPAGATVAFDPATLTPPGVVTMTVSDFSTAPAGTYNITATATSASITKTVGVDLMVFDSVMAAVSLATPADGSTGLLSNPVLTWQSLAGAATYEVEISDNPSFSNTLETATPGGTSYMPTMVNAQGGVYYWRVKGLNICNEGSFSNVHAFQLGEQNCPEYTATNLPLTIPTNQATTVMTTLNVPDTFSISSVRVNLTINHTYVGDLTASVKAPDGTSATLFDRPGVPASNFGCSSNNIITTFSDTAPLSAAVLEGMCNATLPAIAGDFQPVTPFSIFNNKQSNGTWTLTVTDAFNQDGGSVTAWKVTLCNLKIPDSPELLANNLLVVPQAQGEIITNAFLHSDGASPVFSILSLPANGTLNMQGTPLGIGDTFTQEDIDNNYLSYEHDGSATISDGFHFDVLTSANGWLHDEVFNIEILPNTLAVSAILTQGISCHDTKDGIITVNTTGGTMPFQYRMNGGDYQSSNVFENLGGGAYTIQVQDDNGFIVASNEVTVTNPAIIDISTTVVDDEVTITATGGTGTLTYSIDGVNFQPGNVFSGLDNGEYTITVKDENECTESTTFIIAVNAIVASASITQQVSCFNGANGSIKVNLGGGVPPYTYSLNGGSFQSGNTFQNLPPGSYIITVMDNDGLTQNSNTIILANPPQLTGSASVNGYTVTVTASGGTGTLQYSIDGGTTFQSGSTFFPVINGSYTVIIKDSKGCQAEVGATVNVQPVSLTLIPLTEIKCWGANSGEITVIAVGGVPPYSFSINGGPFQSSNIFSGLSAGIHIVTLKDSGGFTSLQTFTLTSPAELTVQTNIAGFDILVTAAGGVPPYEYSIDNGVFQTSNSFIFTANGIYQITVRDANGCEIGVETVVFLPPPAIVNLGVEGISCHNASDASITIVASCSAPTCIYSIDGVNFQAENIFSNLPSGDYTIYVLDGFGNVSVPFAINIPDPPAVTVSASAFGLEITATGSGGTGPLQYSIDGSNYQPGNIFNVIFNGTYTISVIDENGCLAETQVVVNAPEAVFFTVINVSCVDSINGQIIIEGVDGGYPPYLFSLNGEPFTSNLVYTNLGIGKYIFVVQDSTGFLFEAHPLFIDDPFPIVATTTVAGNNLTIIASGGTGLLMYSIDGGATFQPGNVFTNLPNGMYNIVVKDANGCTFTTTALINSTAVNDPQGGLAFEVMPNPSEGLFTLKMSMPVLGEMHLAVYDVAGRVVYRSTVQASGQVLHPLDLRFLANGSYQLQITTGERRGVKRLVVTK